MPHVRRHLRGRTDDQVSDSTRGVVRAVPIPRTSAREPHHSPLRLRLALGIICDRVHAPTALHRTFVGAEDWCEAASIFVTIVNPSGCHAGKPKSHRRCFDRTTKIPRRGSLRGMACKVLHLSCLAGSLHLPRPRSHTLRFHPGRAGRSRPGSLGRTSCSTDCRTQEPLSLHLLPVDVLRRCRESRSPCEYQPLSHSRGGNGRRSERRFDGLCLCDKMCKLIVVGFIQMPKPSRVARDTWWRSGKASSGLLSICCQLSSEDICSTRLGAWPNCKPASPVASEIESLTPCDRIWTDLASSDTLEAMHHDVMTVR